MSVLSVYSTSNAMCDCSARTQGSLKTVSQTPQRHNASVIGVSRHLAENNKSTGFSNYSESLEAELKGLVSMFRAFFNQMSVLLSGRNKEKLVFDETTPDLALPKVEPTPAVTPPTPPLDCLSDKRNGAKADDIWSGFRQGPDGNCVTVSAIKAAMHKFGQSPTDIYKKVSKTERGYAITMRDDFQLTLTEQELKQAATGARFFGRDRGMLKDAQFLFAVSAKRAQMENNDGRAARSFSAAIRSLNDGEDERGAGEGFLRLGLKKYMRRVAVSVLAKGQVGMVNRTGHSVAVIGGKEELWGRKGKTPTHGHAVALVD